MSRAGRKERPISAALTAPIEETVKPTEEEIKEKELNQRYFLFILGWINVINALSSLIYFLLRLSEISPSFLLTLCFQ